MLKIERLTAADLTRLAELFQQFWGEASSIENMRAVFSRLDSNPAYIPLVARHNNHVVGFAMGIICAELYGDCRPFMVIEDLIVDRMQRRSGAGTALMRALEKCAGDHDCCQIIFVTEADRNEAVEFYRSLGYDCESFRGFKKRIGGEK